VKHTKVLVSGAIVVTATLLLTSVVNAQEATTSNAAGTSVTQSNPEPAFGQRGQWYLYTPSLLGYHRSYPDTPLFSDNGFQLGMELGTFVRDHFSVGLQVNGAYGWEKPQGSPAGDRLDNWNTRLALVLGWQRPLSSWVSFWPKLSLGGSYGRSEQYYDSEASKRQLSTYWIDANVRLPLVLHVTRHLFVEIAYEIDAGVVRGDIAHAVQVSSSQALVGLGGWL
jgi:hypothetical protein